MNKHKLTYLMQVFELISGNAYLKDVKGYYVACNQKQLKIARVDTKEALLGKTDRDLYPEAIAEKIIKEDKEIIATHQERTLEEIVVDTDGTEIVCLVHKKPFYNEKGIVIGIIGIGNDVTEIKKAEDKIYELDNVIAQLPGNVYWYSKDFVYLGCNENSAKTLRMARSDTVGKDFRKLMGRIKNVDKKVVDMLIDDGKQVVETNAPKLNIEEPPFTGPEGQPLYWVANKVPLRNRQGETYGVVGISTNITHQKKLELELRLAKEKAEAANKAKTEFLENMRHDIRTPLTGIVGCAQLIQMQSDNSKKVSEYANDLIQSSDALLDFLNKILDSIQVASGEIPILKKKFELFPILEQVISLNKPQTILKNLSFQFNYDPAIPTYLLGDPIRIQRILLELITNALKFTDKGGVEVTARLMKEKTKSGQVIIKLCVSDTGIGILHDKQNEVYTRFKRLTPSYQGIYPGTGLGLSVVKQFIDDLEGEIQLDSQLNHGSTFICLIPFQEPLLITEENEIEKDHAPKISSSRCSQQSANASSLQEMVVSIGNRVLVVEDDKIAAKVAQSILLNLNCQVDIVFNGKMALKNISKNTYDLILMDVGLPDTDGCEITHLIRLKLRNSSSPVIIGLTAHTSDEKKQKCLAMGMNSVYTKPLTKEKALRILTKLYIYKKIE